MLCGYYYYTIKLISIFVYILKCRQKIVEANFSFFFLLIKGKTKRKKAKEINYLRNQVPLAYARRSKFIPAGGLTMVVKASL
jgi:hypothetical protein